MQEKLPKITTALPGPKARAVVENDARWVSPSYTRSYPLVAKRGRGALVEDVDGNLFLDFNAGIAVCSTGHCHPEVVRAIQDQAGKLIHLSGTDFYYALLPEIASLVASFIPHGKTWKTHFGNSGTEAIEAAMKLARFHSGRAHFIAFQNAFHGRTYGALSLTASKPVQRKRFGPLLPSVTHVPFPNPYRDGKDAGTVALNYLRDKVFRSTLDPEEVAAIVVETVQGEGGYVYPPEGFLYELKQLAADNGILVIADEVQSGAGRTGKMFAFEHFDFEPDIIALAKGIASGMPLGMTLARDNLMDWGPGTHASTFGGNPLSLAAAGVTLRLIRDRYMENCRRVGKMLLSGLGDLMARHEMIGDVRGLGLMLALEFVRDRETKEPAGDFRDEVVVECFRRGLIVLGAGPSTIRLSPPLIVDEEQCGFALQTLDGAIAAVSRT
jgi:4-aminobutyrate aminotransferase